MTDFSGMTPISDSRRYCAILLPFLSSDRLRRLPGAPFSALSAAAPLLILAKVKGALQLAAPDPAALEFGLAPGLPLAEARARIADVATADFDAAADAALMERLADGCDRYTPLVARAGAAGLMLDITGAAHLFGGERALLADLLRRLTGLGLAVHAVIAASPATALALAKAGRRGIVPDGAERRSVLELPVAALECDGERTQALLRAGLKTIGALAERPRAPLAARFGKDCVEALERLLGRVDQPISPRRFVPSVLAERIFFEPLSRTEDIGETIVSLAKEIAALLEKRGEGGRLFEAVFFRVDGEVRRIRVATARPNRDPKALGRLFQEKLDALAEPLDVGFGFDLIRLGALRSEPFFAGQASLEGGTLDADAVADLVDRLGARFGAERVLRMAAEDSHWPERRTRYLPFIADGAAGPGFFSDPDADPAEPPLRPLSLFDPPEPVEALAEVPDGPPLNFRWRRVLHHVARAEGPERIAPEWWRQSDDTLDRDYYRVEDREGRRFWLFREGLHAELSTHPRWYMHGLFA